MFGLGKVDWDWQKAVRASDHKRELRARKKILDRLIRLEETVRQNQRRLGVLEIIKPWEEKEE